MNRRNVLLGLGSLAAGSGAVLGSGALDVEAQRTANIDVAGDSSALVGLSDQSSGDVVTTNSNSALEIDLSSTSLNTNSIASVNPAFAVVNNGGTEVNVELDVTVDNSDTDALQFAALDANNTAGQSTPFTSVDITGNRYLHSVSSGKTFPSGASLGSGDTGYASLAADEGLVLSLLIDTASSSGDATNDATFTVEAYDDTSTLDGSNDITNTSG